LGILEGTYLNEWAVYYELGLYGGEKEEMGRGKKNYELQTGQIASIHS